MSSSDRVTRSAMVLTTLCTVMVTGLVVRRELRPSAQNAPAAPRAISQSEWENLLSTGHRIGPQNAKLTIVEFGDFECPVCGSFARQIQIFRQKHPAEFALIYHHFPLDYHAAAMPLAIASECAAKQGKFEVFYDSVFARQREMVLLRPNAIEQKVGLDTLAFAQCSKDTTIEAQVRRDVEVARRIKVRGTPTVLISGKVYQRPVDAALLDSLLRK